MYVADYDVKHVNDGSYHRCVTEVKAVTRITDMIADV
jgi:hypothetical protein